jgi:hypothetical protein
MRRSLTWLALMVATAGPAYAGEDRPAKKAPAAPAPAKIDLKKLAQVLESGSEAEILAALSELGAQGPSAASAAPLVNGLLVRGSTGKVVVAALDAVAAFGAESSSDAVAPYVQHRRPEIRQAAASTLARTKGPSAVRALRRALKSPDPKVRQIAASGLGALNAAEAVDDLFAALGDETGTAPKSIAAMCNPTQCDRLMDYVGKLPFEFLEPSFVTLILRPSGLPDINKLRYIDRLRRLATKSSTNVLQTALADLPASANPKVKEALETALKGRPVKLEEGK